MKLKEKIMKTTKDSNPDAYKCLCSLLGSFLGDALGSYCEFSKQSPLNSSKIFKGYNVFGSKPGQVTDDTEMSLSLAYALMDMPNINTIDQNILYYYYGFWGKSNPVDIGKTAAKALKHFEFNSFMINNPSLFTKPKYMIKLMNILSTTDEFLCRLSPFVAWFYYRNKEYVKSTLDIKDVKGNYELYTKIKEEVKKDTEMTHSNPETVTVSGVFVFMALCAICDNNANDIIDHLKKLLESFKWFTEYLVKNMINETLDSFSKSDFNKEEFFNGISDAKSGNYEKGFKLTLYYLVNFDNIKPESEECTKYRTIINEICNAGGDTDTNAAIVGTIIGPLIGFENFGKELEVLIEFVPQDRFFYSTALIYYFIEYLQESNRDKDSNSNNGIRFNYFNHLLSTMFIEMK